MCTSCSTWRMAETAVHPTDRVLPEGPVRQWVLSFPKRLRYFLQHHARLVNPVLRIFLTEGETALRLCMPDALRFPARRYRPFPSTCSTKCLE